MEPTAQPSAPSPAPYIVTLMGSGKELTFEHVETVFHGPVMLVLINGEGKSIASFNNDSVQSCISMERDRPVPPQPVIERPVLVFPGGATSHRQN